MFFFVLFFSVHRQCDLSDLERWVIAEECAPTPPKYTHNHPLQNPSHECPVEEFYFGDLCVFGLSATPKNLIPE